MSKILPADITALQFSEEQFAQVEDFAAFVQGVIDRQEAILSGRLGVPVFDSVTPAVAAQVKRASLCLCAAELLQLRINRISGNVDADSAAMIRMLQTARTDYLREVKDKVSRLVSTGGSVDTGGYAGGVVESSHFPWVVL